MQERSGGGTPGDVPHVEAGVLPQFGGSARQTHVHSSLILCNFALEFPQKLTLYRQHLIRFKVRLHAACPSYIGAKSLNEDFMGHEFDLCILAIFPANADIRRQEMGVTRSSNENYS